MKKSTLFTTLLFFGLLTGVSAQEYYIEGFYVRYGEGQYILKDVHTNGIYLNGKTSLIGTITGTKENITCDGIPATMVRFSFDKATTDCPSKWENGFVFQYWDEDNNKWKTDVEACKGQTLGYSQKDMVIMLVLDYSGSMKKNISLLQSNAINIINTISKVSDGNIHIGIIAFSGMNQAKSQIFPITPLTKDNMDRFEQFIRNANQGKETALYYSIDRAMQMMEDYVRQMDFSFGNYNGSCIITFTDGLDNASINDNISVTMRRGSKNEYLAYISDHIKGSSPKTILGMPIESFAIGFSGSENFTSDDMNLFKTVLQRIATDNNHLKLATRFEEVDEYFKYIIKQLTSRWENLNMYVGESQYGRVRWVLNCGKAKPAPKIDVPTVKIPSKFWLGLAIEAGNSYYEDRYYNSYYDYWDYSYESCFHAGLRLDASYQLCSWFAIGGTASFGIMTGDMNFAYRIGPLAKFTFSNGSALLAGAGIGTYCEPYEILPYISLGWKFKSPWYITVSANYGASYSFGVGYSFFGGK